MDGLKLINPEFEFGFAGKEYKIRRANLEKVILFQKKMVELADAKDSAVDLKGAGYCLYLILKDADPSITENWVMENAPGDLDAYEVFENLGFMSRQKVELLKRLIQRNAPAQTGEESSGS